MKRYAILMWTALAAGSGVASASTIDFLDDDPLWLEPDSQDASGVRPWEIDLMVDLAYNQFGHPGDPAPNVRARDLNTLDEVPDSSWFTNRAGYRPLTADQVAKGPDTTNGPSPGPWTVVSAKHDGVMPGFVIEDSSRTRWFLKFDPPGHRGMATSTEVVVTKLLWALGYNVPENHIATFRRDQLVVGEGASFHAPGRKKRAMERKDIDRLLEKVAREPDGSYRVLASKALEGKPLGGFRFYGTRPDDPNDVVPHEHRRELRGYGTFSAWLNHVDAKAINTLDTLVPVNGRSVVRHNLLDFGSTLGSGGTAPRERWEGFEYMIAPGETARGMLAFGFDAPRWRSLPFYDAPSIGRLPRDNSGFDPESWRPRFKNPAFLRARADDKFWAASKLAAIGEDTIRAAVHEGELGDDEAEAVLAKALIERRAAICKKYLTAINPVVQPELGEDGRLTFRNAAVDAGFAAPPASYRALWWSFDNKTGAAERIGEVSAADASLASPARLPNSVGAFVKAQISATGGADPSWETPVDAYFRRTTEGWKLVGFERMPE
jgi:hypothetical protein